MKNTYCSNFKPQTTTKPYHFQVLGFKDSYIFRKLSEPSRSKRDASHHTVSLLNNDEVDRVLIITRILAVFET